MQNSARCVLPVTSTSRCRSARSTSQGGVAAVRRRQLRERDLELVDAVVPRLVDARRLARRADEQSREQVRQRRVVVPVGDQAAQQIGPAQERAVGRRRAAEHEVVAAAGAGVAAVEHELLGRRGRACLRLLVERRRLLDQLVPVARRLHVHLDHAGVGRDDEVRQPRIVRRRIAFEQHRHAERARRRFDGGDELEVVLERLDRRHEDVAARRRAARRTARCARRRRPIRRGDGGCRRPRRGRLDACRSRRGCGRAAARLPTRPAADGRRRPRRRIAPRTARGSGGRGANGSSSSITRRSSGATHGSESSGSR